MNINKIQKTRSQIRVIKDLVSDNIDDISDIEISVIYNDLSKISSICLDRLMLCQSEYEHQNLIRECEIDRCIAYNELT